MRRLPSAVCALAGMLVLAATPAGASGVPASTTTTTAPQPMAVTITGLPGDVYTATGQPVAAPASDPADLISASASDDGTTLHLSAKTVALNDPKSDPNWRNVTYIAWLLDPTFSGHPRYAVYYDLDASGNYAGTLFSFLSGQTIACQVTLAFDPTNGYQASLPASCLQGATSFQWLVYSFYDTVSTDTTGADGFGKSLPDFHTGASPFAGKVSGTTTPSSGANPSASPIPAAAPAVHSPTPTAYWLAGADGSVYTYGSARYYGSAAALHLKHPVVAIAPTPDYQGYWLVTSTGAIYHFGDAKPHGSKAGTKLAAPIVAMASTADGKGYWLASRAGTVYHFGDAKALGQLTGKKGSAPVVGLTTTSDGRGYWLAASSGAVYHFGDAKPYGSELGKKLPSPIVGIAATPDSKGYWLVTSTGTVYHFGDAKSFGSEAGVKLASPIVGIAPTSDGLGYRLVEKNGRVLAFGDAHDYISHVARGVVKQLVGIASFG